MYKYFYVNLSFLLAVVLSIFTQQEEGVLPPPPIPLEFELSGTMPRWFAVCQ